jgi:pyruvate dehydrogenase E2 component (dihydrolipoamide acetyltransferase)
MPVEVILPKVDMDMSTGTISVWHVKDGETVKKGQPLFDIETDKAAMEIESPGDGVIRIGDAPVRAVVPIGTVVAMIFGAGEQSKAFAAPPPAAVSPQSDVLAKADSPASAPVGGHAVVDGGKLRATPLARRLARQAGVTLDSISGSGPRGRIVAADVGAAKPAAVAAAPAPAVIQGLDSAAVKALYQPGSYDVKPLDGMRRTIAQRLTHAKQTVPHFYLSASCVIDELLAVRERLNANAPRSSEKTPAWKLSVNDFVIKALALGLQKVPAANVTYTDDGILRHRGSDVGVAVSVDGGLFTPIIRGAELKPLSAISLEMKELAAKARARKLQPAEYSGGTTAVSNLGMFGVEQFNAIINPPQATILAVGAGIETFVPVNKLPVLKTVMNVTLSCDHRAVDGAVGAELLAAFKALIEDPAMMLV